MTRNRKLAFFKIRIKLLKKKEIIILWLSKFLNNKKNPDLFAYDLRDKDNQLWRKILWLDKTEYVFSDEGYGFKRRKTGGAHQSCEAQRQKDQVLNSFAAIMAQE